MDPATLTPILNDLKGHVGEDLVKLLENTNTTLGYVRFDPEQRKAIRLTLESFVQPFDELLAVYQTLVQSGAPDPTDQDKKLIAAAQKVQQLLSGPVLHPRTGKEIFEIAEILDNIDVSLDLLYRIVLFSQQKGMTQVVSRFTPIYETIQAQHKALADLLDAEQPMVKNMVLLLEELHQLSLSTTERIDWTQLLLERFEQGPTPTPSPQPTPQPQPDPQSMHIEITNPIPLSQLTSGQQIPINFEIINYDPQLTGHNKVFIKDSVSGLRPTDPPALGNDFQGFKGSALYTVPAVQKQGQLEIELSMELSLADGNLTTLQRRFLFTIVPQGAPQPGPNQPTPPGAGSGGKSPRQKSTPAQFRVSFDNNSVFTFAPGETQKVFTVSNVGGGVIQWHARGRPEALVQLNPPGGKLKRGASENVIITVNQQALRKYAQTSGPTITPGYIAIKTRQRLVGKFTVRATLQISCPQKTG